MKRTTKRRRLPLTVRLTAKASIDLREAKRLTGRTKQDIVELAMAQFVADEKASRKKGRAA